MLKKLIVLTITTLFFAQTSFAEDLMVNPGTRVSITLPNSISSDSIAHDGTITAIVTKDVIVNDKVVFSKGSMAGLNVQDVQHRAIFGKPGKIILNGGYVEDVNKERHPINFSYEVDGRSRRAASITYTVVSIPLVLFWVGLLTLPVAISMKGKEATMQGGQVFEVHTTAAQTAHI